MCCGRSVPFEGQQQLMIVQIKWRGRSVLANDVAKRCDFIVPGKEREPTRCTNVGGKIAVRLLLGLDHGHVGDALSKLAIPANLPELIKRKAISDAVGIEAEKVR